MIKEYTAEELTEKIDQKLQELYAIKTEEELEQLATSFAVQIANIILADGEYSYNAETKTIYCNTK